MAWRQAKASRMLARFGCSKASGEAQINDDIWALEAKRAAMPHANRLHRPRFHSRLSEDGAVDAAVNS